MDVSIICEAAPTAGRINEDACYFETDSEQSLAAVIDGASQRIAFPLLEQLQASTGAGTAAAFVAQHTRDFIKQHPDLAPVDLIVQANQALRQTLETVISPLTAETITQHLPDYADLLHEDPRFMRLMLPACVLTVVKVDHKNKMLSFAHVGDTALYTFDEADRVRQITSDQMRQHDQRALEVAMRVKQERGAQHLAAVLGLEDVQQANLQNGIYHNYVDEQGAPDAALGVGVIDGLPEIASYVETGEFSIASLSGILLCSDGFQLPDITNETPQQTDERLSRMYRMMLQQGLDAYMQALREIEAQDQQLDQFPRFKVHDDATAIWMRFS